MYDVIITHAKFDVNLARPSRNARILRNSYLISLITAQSSISKMAARSAGKSTPNLTQETKLNREMIAEQNRLNTYKVLAKYRKRNMLMFGGLLASVCGICIL